jgi:hypothetical protein
MRSERFKMGLKGQKEAILKRAGDKRKRLKKW